MIMKTWRLTQTVCQSQLYHSYTILHIVSLFIGTSIYNEEAAHDNEKIIFEVEDEGRPSRIVVGDFSVPLERYFRVKAFDRKVTFEVLCHEATDLTCSYVNRNVLVTQCLSILAEANQQVKKDGGKDEELYLSKVEKNKGSQYKNSIWVTGRMKIMSDSHCKLVPD